MDLKNRINPNTVPIYYFPIQTFLETNDIDLKWKKVRRLFPAKIKKTGRESWNTTDVDEAWKSGVIVSLTSDWSPSGSKNLLWELKVADWWNKKSLDNLFSDYELVKMVTVNPAISINLSDSIGKIEPNYLADLVVINDNYKNPYRALLDASDSDVLLVMIDGDAKYGTTNLMQDLGKTTFEKIGCDGWIRVLDITDSSIDKGTQSWNDITDILEQEMNSDDFQSLLSKKSTYGSQLLPTPLFSSCDDNFFNTLEQSTNEDFSNLFEMSSNKIPLWIKNNAKWWVDDTIDDDTFTTGIEFLIKENIINVSSNIGDSTSGEIPSWVKNNAKWWAEGTISEDDFVSGIEYLVNQGIISVY